MPSALAAFVRLSRLKFLVGGFAGGAFGTALAAYATGRLELRAYAYAQATITAFHLMTHYANDYFDRACDARSRRTPYSGGSGVLVEGSLAPAVALRAALVCAGIGLVGIVALATNAHVAAGALGLAIALGAWAYSAPPLRLLARGLGEIDTAIVVAMLVPLCAYTAQGAPLDLRAFASTLPGAAAMLAMMLAVEYPDLASDAVGGKRNLVVRLGPRAAAKLGLGFAAAVYAAGGLATLAGAPPRFFLCEVLTLPIALGYARALAAWRATEPSTSELLAARGVRFFFVVTLAATLAYALPLVPGIGARETNGFPHAVTVT